MGASVSPSYLHLSARDFAWPQDSHTLVPRPGPRSSAFSQGMAILILALPMPGSFASFVSRPQRPPLLECVIFISSNLYDGRHGQQFLVLACRFFFLAVVYVVRHSQSSSF